MMKNRSRLLFAVVSLGTVLVLQGLLMAQPPVEADSKNVLRDAKDEQASQLLNAFMVALLIADFDASAEAVFPLTHRSNYNLEQNKLSRDLLDFSFKKAHTHAKFYQVPVVVTRVQELKTTEIGHPNYNSYEKGSERKYWIAKKLGINGMPAPIAIFFPADGGEPKISYMGSL